MWFFKLFKKKIDIPYYKDYPEQPYVSPDRDIKKWLEETKLFPEQSFVHKNMMVRNNDNLLPGHLYMLSWLSEFNLDRKEIPLYFEYKYGIDFNNELLELKKLSLINEKNNVTNEGSLLIAKYQGVVVEHKDPTGQKRYFNKLIDKNEYLDIDKFDYFGLYRLGEELYKRNEFEEAEIYLLKSIDKGNTAPGIFKRLAILYRKLKRYEDEINILISSKETMKKETGIYDEVSYSDINIRIEKAKALLLKQKNDKKLHG